ncbi:ARID DNA-binding domain, High mobility group box domain protein [Artemisia annua]|uniref:ARID DNA-binding domain, High mobility group box domain protein n=1 Tax=Artemisia annua TaxID=35608 RepID=A0A2U1L4A1_ARTAN|nr:ARID DNA-binding domain, High mobility group box domain protein [Artemisia annua]
MTACSSTENKSSVPIKDNMQYYLYPTPVCRYEDVIANPKFFMDTLGKFHAAMGTKFKYIYPLRVYMLYELLKQGVPSFPSSMIDLFDCVVCCRIPIVGGRDLDLHRLFMEVTSRGGIRKVLEEKKWRDVTNCFSFPPSATNASFILRKYYMSLIHHFEQVYYFKAKAWTPFPSDTWQNTQTTPTSMSGMSTALLPSPEVQMNPLKQSMTPSEEPPSVKRQRKITEQESLPEGCYHDLLYILNNVKNKYENRKEDQFIQSIKIDHSNHKSQLKTVECNIAGSTESPIGLPVSGVIDGKFESGYLCTVRIGGEQLHGVLYQTVQTPSYDIPKHEGVVTQGSTIIRHRRRRRKKSEIKKRDPAHPKPNRSGYNFFFAEEHARLKLLHTGKDRAISRLIGEEWNKLTESEKAVYQEKAVKDKERYKSEMEHYREGIKREQVLTNVMPLQQQYYTVDTNMLVENIHGNSQEPEPNSGSSKDDNSSFEGEEITTAKEHLNLEMGAENFDIEMKPKEELNKLSFNIEDNGKLVFLGGSLQQKSMQGQENEPLITEHESACFQDNESKPDGKIPDAELIIPDINGVNTTKLVDNEEHALVNFDGLVDNRPLVTSEENVEKNAKDAQPLYFLGGMEH